ncbi:hypothetical protein OG762_52410 (plasmid) [Streptomyces sp. NBC_01136]|uniref:hypothetical protein n=1 Tax=Streptomyces sp. NBC_01136 TaxID=2903754 RepID=UPI0037DD2278|nr:hypothetical protein OG762_52410 [Streptomyces sp. NBC_01136]
MQSLRSDLALIALAVVGVAADLACVLTGHTPPNIFDQVALAGLTGAAGVAMQQQRTPDPTAADSTQAPATYQAVPAAQVPQSSAAVVQPYSGPVGQ